MTTIQGVIDPIDGNDATGQPITDGQPIFAFKTLDFFYNTFTGPDNLLIATVRKGTVVMNQLLYNLLTVTTNDEVGNLRTDGTPERSITLNNCTVNLPWRIVPLDQPHNGTDDVPVIRTTGDIFYVGQFPLDITQENILNGTRNDDDPIQQRSRIIFEHESVYFFENNGGTVDLPDTNSAIHYNGIAGIVGFFDTMNTTNHFAVSLIDNNESIGIMIDGSAIPQCNWNIRPIIDTPTKINDFSLLEKLLIGLVIGIPAITGVVLAYVINPILGVIITVISVVGALVITLRYLFDTFPQGTNKIKVDKTKIYNKCIQLLGGKSRYNKLTSFLNKLQTNNNTKTFQMSGGEFINKSPDLLKLYLTNAPSNLNRINITGGEIASPDTPQEIAEAIDYNITYDTNSYNNNGSIFRRAQLIDSNYIHTRFDGNLFMVDASNGNIVITVPTNVLEDRLFYYKRIDSTNNQVRITTPNGIDNCTSVKLNNKGCKLPKARLSGYRGKLWIL